MKNDVARYRLELLGVFRLSAPDGRRIGFASRKGMALVAMLAMASGGERTRTWLQDRLWGSRQRAQAQQSLRRELGNLRQLVPEADPPLITADYDRVRLDLARCSVDVLHLMNGAMAGEDAAGRGEFLEGFDIPGEDAFEDWLRDQRGMIAARRQQPAISAPIRSTGPQAPETGSKPGLAMLPTVSGSDARNAARFSSLENDLLDRLTRIRWLSLIGPGTVAALRDGVGGQAAISAAVGARYLLELTPAAEPGDEGAAVTLTDATSWRTLLSARLSLAQPDESQAGACQSLVAVIDARIENAEQARVLQRPLQALGAEDRLWRARWHVGRLNRADAELARKLIAEIVAEQPDSPEALIQSGFAQAWRIWAGRGSAEEMAGLRRTALRAVAADRFDARGHLLVGMAETWLRQHERARLALEEAIGLNPSLGQAYMQLGSALYLGGAPESALEPMETALSLSPQDNQIFCVLAERGMVRLMLGNHDGAVESAELALIRRPAYWYAHLIKITALVLLGRRGDARAARADLRRAKPAFRPEHVDWLPFRHPRWPDSLKQGFHDAE